MLRLMHLLAAALCCCISAVSQVTAPQVMANAVKAINAAPSLQADFTATSSDNARIEGTLCMRHDRFSMVTQQVATWYDGSHMWTYSKSAGETSLTSPTDEELLEANPFFIINQYSAYYKPRITKHAGASYVIRLASTSKDAPMKSADITVNSATWLPTKVAATFANGSSILIDITSMHVLKSALPASAFTYPADKYPGIEVIDLR